MQQGVGEGVTVGEVGRSFELGAEGMVAGDLAQALDEGIDFLGGRADPEPAAVLLHHVHAGAPVRRVEHEQ